ncbi:MAG: hypothetical protein ACOZQL_33700 [Myxococcota bacterium]
MICGVAPLWATRAIPLVDLPQHLHLISVLHRLDDASTLFPEVFARRPELTPYLGYYYAVSLLNWLLPLELANRLFLSAYVVGLPLSLAFLLHSLKRPTWPALLAIPFAWGDSFAWGFINYCASLPLALLTCALFVRTIDARPEQRRNRALALAVALVAVLLFHVQSFAWLGVALPFLLLTTPAPEGKTWRARVPALLGVVPGVLLFVLWVGLRVGQPQEIAPGQPWRSWGPMLSKENLGWKSFDQNVSEFLDVSCQPGARRVELGISLCLPSELRVSSPILAGMVPDGGDQQAVRVVLLIAFAALLAALGRGLVAKVKAKAPATRALAIAAALGLPALVIAWVAAVRWLVPRAAGGEAGPLVSGAIVLLAIAAALIWLGTWLAANDQSAEGPIVRWRIAGLAALAFVLLFALPFDIRGYMYYLNTRYAHLAAALLVAAVPVLPERWSRAFLFASAAAALLFVQPLWSAFRAFDAESAALTELAQAAADKPRVMGLIYATGSRAVTHPVYLHASCVVARERGGLTNFSFALTPHSPLMYRGEPPPTFPSEWRPDQMRWDEQGRHYDHFVLRGARPEQLFGPRLQTELFVAAQAGDFFLVRKR